ncbi:MAG: EpsI family protein [Fimbriimonadales bacterium]|nr:EpsI family protein [Fimbriimonadales bacterium]
MARLTSRVYVVAALVLATGVLASGLKPDRSGAKSEPWMEEHLPRQVGSFSFVPGSDNPNQTYRMEESTYELLKPYGIVCRVFRFGGEAYDAVVIASSSRETFHDPSVCFSGQGWDFDRFERVVIPTATRGGVPATLAVAGASGGSGPKRLALYFYKSDRVFVPTTLAIKWELFKAQLTRRRAVDGVFYRFIPLHPNPSREALISFVGEFLDAANASSDGYF